MSKLNRIEMGCFDDIATFKSPHIENLGIAIEYRWYYIRIENIEIELLEN